MEGKEEKGWREKEGEREEGKGGNVEVVGEGGIKRKMDHLNVYRAGNTKLHFSKSGSGTRRD